MILAQTSVSIKNGKRDEIFCCYPTNALGCIARVGLMHIGVFILLLLSGERNFGVRLNKPYTATVPMDIPVFTGNYRCLLSIVLKCTHDNTIIK